MPPSSPPYSCLAYFTLDPIWVAAGDVGRREAKFWLGWSVSSWLHKPALDERCLKLTFSFTGQFFLDLLFVKNCKLTEKLKEYYINYSLPKVTFHQHFAHLVYHSCSLFTHLQNREHFTGMIHMNGLRNNFLNRLRASCIILCPWHFFQCPFPQNKNIL